MPLLLPLLTACAQPARETATPPGYRQATEAPIQVMVNAHGHNYQTHATPEDPDWWSLKTEEFWAEHAALLSLAEQVEDAGGLLSAQLNGEFARDAALLVPEGLPQLEALLQSGHSFGAHFHDEALEEMEEWLPLSDEGLTHEEHVRIWTDHIQAVEGLAGRTVLRVDAAMRGEEADTQKALEDHHDVRLASAGDAFSYTPWAHSIWSPLRADQGLALTEDPSSPQVRLGVYSQIGKKQPSGLHALPTTVSQLQRHFLQVMAQWTWDQLDPAAPRVWTFGLMTHPDQLDLSLEELQAFLTWLEDTFGDRVGPSGQPVYELVSDEEVLQRHQEWERRWPRASSFDFDFEGWLDGDCPVYPYPLEGLAIGLRDAEVVQEMRLDPGLVGWTLQQREITRGTRRSDGWASVDVGELGATLWMLQSTNGSTTVLDLRERLPPEAMGIDLTTGRPVPLDLSAVTVSPMPALLIEDPNALNAALDALACDRPDRLSPLDVRPTHR